MFLPDPPPLNRPWLLALALLLLPVSGRPARSAHPDDLDSEPIRYSKSAPDNVVSRLQDRLAAGKARLDFDRTTGYLPSLLKELKVPVSSQTLVFSKTSLQRQRISPRTPRALYFSDDVYVGFCHQGDVLEISAVDTKLGTVFYTLDQKTEEGGKTAKPPVFARQTDSCTLCHASSQTQGVPGHVVRSVYPDHAGLPILSAGTIRVDQTTPIEKRWGGWYVSGTHGGKKQPHLGNLIIRTRHVSFPVDNSDGLNVTDLSEKFSKKNYLSGHSDIVALMVLEHQAQAHNLLTRASFETRKALHYEEQLNRELKLPATNRWDSTKSRIQGAGDDLVEYLFFCEEAPLTARMRGTSGFAAEFSKRGPIDSRGRSLRDFDLESRLFRYRLSYLIYSESFDALPGRVRDYVLERMWNVLQGKDTSKKFAHLGADERKAIREILAETKPNLPAYWRGSK